MVNISKIASSLTVHKLMDGVTRPARGNSVAMRESISSSVDTFVSTLAKKYECVFSNTLLKRTTPIQQKKLKELYAEFCELQSRNPGRSLCGEAAKIIKKDSLLHGTHYDKTTFEQIIKEGLISPDIAKTKEGLRVCNGSQRTIGGIDTWVADKERSISEYFHEYLGTRPEDLRPNTPLSRSYWRGENRFIDLARERGNAQNSIVFVINPKNTKLELFTEHSITPATCNSKLKYFSGKMTNQMYINDKGYVRHTFIPVGIPSTYFEKIIVGDKISQKQIEEMHAILAENGLNTKIFNSKGELLLPLTKLGLKKFNFTEFGKKGVPLQYSRAEFINDIKKTIGHLPKEEQEKILAKFNMKYSLFDIEGFPLDIECKRDLTQTEKIISELINKFNTNNSIKVENPQVQAELNSILKEMPEFRMIIGKQQHTTHLYSVDIHTLEVLRNALSNEATETLSTEGKEILRLSVLMHDFGKCGGVITPEHAKDSCVYARQVLAHYNLEPKIKNRILNLIANHHWFQAYNTGGLTKEGFCEMFPNSEDRIIAKIFAKADFESVSPDFHLAKLDKSKKHLTQSEYEQLFKKIMDGLA